MTSAALPSEFAVAAYRAALRPPAPRHDPDRPAALEDRGSLLDLVLSPRHAAILRPAFQRSLLAGLSTRQALPLTAASA